jgi:hypothetical protein
MTPLLMLALNCLFIGAQAPKPPPTALEGTWREPLLPGEKAANRLAVTITGDEITVVWYDGVYRGSIQVEAVQRFYVASFRITRMDEKGQPQEKTHIGRCLLENSQLWIQVNPVPVPVRRGGSQFHELAPVTFHLKKVQK